MDEAAIKHMVERFLAWRLPDPWRPDGGISFTPMINQATGKPYAPGPTGTNLFDYTQAEAMVRHMVEDLSPQ